MTNIIITGSNGFLGSHLMQRLPDAYGVPSKAYDLRRLDHVETLFKHAGKPDIIFHLAANVGGISHNLSCPASIFYDNLTMNTLLINKAAQMEVGKFVFVGSVCSYPLKTKIPTKEEELGTGWPEPSNMAYGMSKLLALVHLRACQKQYALNFSYPLLANLYGPGDGGFNHPEKAHLIPNLIRKVFDKPDVMEMYGNGKLTRDLLYVEDAADVLVKVAEVDYSEPVNISTNTEVSIKEIALTIADITDYRGTFCWPDEDNKGEQRRRYDNSRADKVLGWQPRVDIREGLERTVKWYKLL